MTSYDAYASRYQQLHNKFVHLQAIEADIERAKKQWDRDEKKKAEYLRESQMKGILDDSISIDPHLIYYLAKTQKPFDSDLFKNLWVNQLPIRTYNYLPFSPRLDSFSLKQLSYGSILFDLSFVLMKPYISKDDTDFYIIDNPVLKEWLFNVPMIAASSWKGALRSAIRSERHKPGEEDKQKESNRIERLFGTATDDSTNSSDTSKTGRLFFYPTFFEKNHEGKLFSIEMMNPHSRESGAGDVPIPLECVPAGCRGKLSILYVPQLPISVSKQWKETTNDLLDIFGAVRSLFLYQGIGAKTSSGFGRLGRLTGQVTAHLPSKQEPQTEALPTWLIKKFRDLEEVKVAIQQEIKLRVTS